MEDKTYSIRPINRFSTNEVELVAERMRLTLEEVLGKEKGQTMYSSDWLIHRVQQHIKGELDGEVFLSLDLAGIITGHTIVRVDSDEKGTPIGLFSTIYVDPLYRRQSFASQLIIRGEQWMREKGLVKFSTYTSTTNIKLINLFRNHGYEVAAKDNQKDMVIMEKIINVCLQ